jgi:hypothetical protein
MIAPTKLYQHVPTLSPEEAADLIVQAIIYRPERIATRVGIFAQVLHAVAPKLYAVIMNTAFRLFPESTAAKSQQATPRSHRWSRFPSPSSPGASIGNTADNCRAAWP